MSTRHDFSNEAIEDFCNQYGVTITYSAEQKSKLTDGERIPLMNNQISNIVDQLCTDESSLRKFIVEITTKLNPISLSLYVLNDDLWKIMTRKHELPDKMLPMVTMPWFYWEKEAEERKNPAGVIRKEDSVQPLTIDIGKEVLKISGNGGDFCGLLEGRIVDRFKGVRPLLIPGDTGPKKTVPNYEAQFIQINININSSETVLYPNPKKELDYNFSEHPKVFYSHGIQIIAEGKDVVLKVGNRRNTELRGKVLIFIGKNFEQNDESSNLLLFHVWLSILNRNPFL